MRGVSTAALQMSELQTWHRVAKRQGWDEVLYDIREELQRRADRPGPERGR